MFRAFTLIALAAYASAQLSSNCTSTVAGIITNSDAASCLSASFLLPVLSALDNSNLSSLISSVDNWLKHLCAVPACSNATLAAIAQNITVGCQSELGLSQTNSTNSTNIIGSVQQYYLTFIKLACLKDGNTNCITQTLTNIQNITSIQNTVDSVITGSVPFMTGAESLSNLPTNISCTNCLKAMYNTLPSSVEADIMAPLQSHCGASFVDGRNPPGIVESATTSTSTSSNLSAASGRVSLLSHGVFSALSLSGLVLISTMFTLLA